MSGDDAGDERRQEIEKLIERIRKRVAADEITDERGRVAEEKINEAGRAKNVCGHFGICEIDEERRPPIPVVMAVNPESIPVMIVLRRHWVMRR